MWGKDKKKKKKKIDSEPVYNKEVLNTKVKSHGDKVTVFYDKKVPMVDPNHSCLARSSLDSALKKDRNYYPQAFSNNCKYTE